VVALATALLGCAGLGLGAAPPAELERSVVRILNHSQRGDWYTPWNPGHAYQSSATGFIIEGNQVMTNAHVVSDSRVLLLYLHGDPTPHEARVVAIGHDCDLALIEPVEPGLLEGLPAMRFGGLPALRSTVETYGYPAGGQRLSSTRGVVSRIEHGVYAHSSGDAHLAAQTDAALNPGNSGGPVVQDGLVVGVAFQTSSDLENVGFFIPTEVVEHFLTDVADGSYDGYPDLGVRVANLENVAARRHAKMGPGQAGVRVDFVYPESSADGVLRKGDVLLEVEAAAIANDGSVAAGDLRFRYEMLIDRRQVGESLSLAILRDGERLELQVPMKRYDPFDMYRRIYDELPRYYVYAGLVFVPLTSELFAALSTTLPAHLVYEAYLRPIAEAQDVRKEPVVLLRRLDHSANSELAWYVNLVVDQVNGQRIDGLEELIAAIESHEGRFQVLEFGYYGRMGVLERDVAEGAHQEILDLYGIPKDRRL
jgi:S1-C subfamily serine protease